MKNFHAKTLYEKTLFMHMTTIYMYCQKGGFASSIFLMIALLLASLNPTTPGNVKINLGTTYIV